MSIIDLNRQSLPAEDAVTADTAAQLYREENNLMIMKATEEANSTIQTRVEDVIKYAENIHAKKIGIATCVGLLGESRTLAKILRKRGFDVFGVCCKVGSTKKECVGITKEQLAGFKTGPIMCNPVMQAKLLNQQDTDFNVVMGLCVGHDSLFLKYAEKPCISLVIKDRVLGNNPAAALYTTSSFYKHLLEPQTTPCAIEFLAKIKSEREAQ